MEVSVRAGIGAGIGPTNIRAIRDERPATAIVSIARERNK